MQRFCIRPTWELEGLLKIRSIFKSRSQTKLVGWRLMLLELGSSSIMGRLKIEMKLNNYVYIVMCTMRPTQHAIYIFIEQKSRMSKRHGSVHLAPNPPPSTRSTHWLVASQQTQHDEPALALHWHIGCGAGTTFSQHCHKVSCLAEGISQQTRGA